MATWPPHAADNEKVHFGDFLTARTALIRFRYGNNLLVDR